MAIRNKIIFLLKNFLLFNLLFFTASTMAQDEEEANTHYNQEVEVRQLDEKKWKSLTKDLDFNDNQSGQKRKKQVIHDSSFIDDDAERTSEFEEKEEETEDSSLPPFLFNLGKTGQLIMYGAIIIALIVVLYKLLAGNLFGRGKKNETEKTDADFLEEEINESDLDRYLKDALNKKEYKLAIRIYYLMILKELSLKNWIQWKKDKTNKEYLYEMSSREDYRPFFETTRLFEKVWYGDSEINESEYLSISPVFKNLVEGIKNKQA